MKKIGDHIASRPVTIEDGSTIDFPLTGQKQIVFFYPKDNTPGCTAEACGLRDGYADLRKMGFEVFGVSVDGTKSHQKFIANHNLPFRLISDESKLLVEEFGLWGKKKFMGREYMGTNRATFLIDESGTITHVIDKVDTKDAANQIISLLSL